MITFFSTDGRKYSAGSITTFISDLFMFLPTIIVIMTTCIASIYL